MSKKNVELAIIECIERLGMPLSITALIEILKFSYTEAEIRRGARNQMFEDSGRLTLRMDWRLEVRGT